MSANLATLEQARLDTRISDYEFRAYAELLVAQVEEAYWDLMLAERRIEIFEESLRLAEQQLNDTRTRISIGQLAEVELAAVQAELALRRENLINARGELALRKLILLRLMNPPGVDLGLEDLVLTEQPVLPEATGESVAMHVGVAMKMRPDLNQARLEIQRGELEVVKTKNGLLPYLDAFITLGKTAIPIPSRNRGATLMGIPTTR
jgi:outer membrane protein TolC